MLPPVIERFSFKTRLIFDVVDRFAQDRVTPGAQPRPIVTPGTQPRPIGTPSVQPRPIGTLRFFLVGRMNGMTREDFVPPWELIVQQNAGGYYLFYGQVMIPGIKSPLRMKFSADQYFARIDSDYYQRAERIKILIPDVKTADSLAPYAVDLEPGYAYPFPTTVPVRPGAAANPIFGQPGPTLLRGSLHKQNKEAIEGATVEVVGQSNKYLTDKSGQWVLVFEKDNQQTGSVAVQITLPNNNVIQVQNVRVIKGCEASLPESAIIGLP
jgi:hypothetical protein